METLKPGIVRITTKPEGLRQTGTGCIFKLEPGIAYILTAYHVVAGDNAPQVEFFSRRNQPVKAEIIKLQPDKRDGLGLIAVRGKENLPPDLIPLPIAMDSKISGGDALQTIGFGAGQGDWAVLPASILAIDGSDLKLDGRFKPGNSGGPVLKEGKVVGILTDEQEGVGLASLVSVVRIVLQGWGVDPSIERTTAANRAEKPGAVANAPTSSPINLLSPRNGGRLLVAPVADWKTYAEDSAGSSVQLDQEGVWGFKDGQSALLESFSILTPKTSASNVGEVELFYGNDDPYGKFESIGKFNPRNVLMVETPHQEFKFAPVRAKYFKVRVLSSHRGEGYSSYVYGFRLFGRLE